MMDRTELAKVSIESVTKSYKACHTCFWMFHVCNPMLCTVLWAINALFFIWFLRFCVSLCFPEKRKASTVSSARSTGRTSQDNGSTETANLLTPIPFTPFYVDNVV